MLNLAPALNTASLKLGIALMNLRNIPRYIIHDDGTYEIVDNAIEAVEEGIQAFTLDGVDGAGGGYVSTPAKFQYTIPWDLNILYEGLDMMMGMLRNVIPIAIWGFLIISGIHLFINIARALMQ